ncbi:aminomethyltransferase family protein [Desulfobacter latus]|uniref:Aminomethyl transferase family protein n=1 Tax=Desulfobacter latus TaxID=2292 RepID=A0A850T6L5_9BACT|nr:aminomethyl transferase family protein [Desulfobacter latus]NWH06741.1 aminomethyl transferase family protein [Desulfobacter latus]
MTNNLKKTPLNAWHRNAGANMADFGGFDMPLWYDTGVKNEHLAVLKSAGMFDTSHMDCVRVQGKDAPALLDFCFTRQLSDLSSGRCIYGAFLDAKGHCIDDAIIYKFSDISFMVCVNAGMGASITGHLVLHRDGKSVEITDLSDQLAKLDVQGKNALKIVSGLIKDQETVFDKMPYFSFKGNLDPDAPDGVTLVDGTPVIVSRTGYTGEFGFEIFIAPDNVEKLWHNLLDAGSPYALIPCGLGARDSLRAGACLPLSHQDIGHFPFINHPWEFALPFKAGTRQFTKTFLGDKSLMNLEQPSFTYAFVGDSLRKVTAGDAGRVLTEQGEDIGMVLTCATDMGIFWHEDNIVSINTPDLPPDVKIKGLACGFVRVNQPLDMGARLSLVEGKRKIGVRLVSDIRPDRTARLAIKHFK